MQSKSNLDTLFFGVEDSEITQIKNNTKLLLNKKYILSEMLSLNDLNKKLDFRISDQLKVLKQVCIQDSWYFFQYLKYDFSTNILFEGDILEIEIPSLGIILDHKLGEEILKTEHILAAIPQTVCFRLKERGVLYHCFIKKMESLYEVRLTNLKLLLNQKIIDNLEKNKILKMKFVSEMELFLKSENNILNKYFGLKGADFLDLKVNTLPLSSLFFKDIVKLKKYILNLENQGYFFKSEHEVLRELVD